MNRVVPPASGLALPLRAGAVIRIEQLGDGQCVDLNAFALADPGEHFDAARTRTIEGTRPTVGASLWSSARHPEPLLRIVHDDVGCNDLLFPACSEFEYRHFAGLTGHTNCMDILAEAIREYGLGPDAVHDPINLWLEGEVLPGGRLASHPVRARRGHAIDLVACTDVLVALSACGDDIFGSSQFEMKPVAVSVRGSGRPAPSASPGLVADPDYRAAYDGTPIAVHEIPVNISSDALAGLDRLVARGDLGTTPESVARAALFTWWQQTIGEPFGARDPG